MLVPTTLEDLDAIEPAETFDMDWQSYFKEVADRPTLEAYLATYCRTSWFKGELLGIGGVTPLWDHVGELWMCPDVRGLQHPLVITRELLRTIEHLRHVTAAHRFQITLAPNASPSWRRFIRRIGFQREGTLRSYIRPGEDYELFSRLWVH